MDNVEAVIALVGTGVYVWLRVTGRIMPDYVARRMRERDDD